jgi:hypothetical protein
MSSLLRTVADYELYLYSLTTQYPEIRRSTLVLVRRGSTLARVEGELLFDYSLRLVVRERLLANRSPAVIDAYGYEVWQENVKLYWYDSQPHPNDPTLQSTHPHHKHVPPDIKHNRIPAPDMSFKHPNLPVLIQEIEEIIVQMQQSARNEDT